MKHRIITISREFGSGGRTIGKKVAEALGVSCYDNELIQKIAAESGFNENYILDTGEDAPGGFLASAFSHRASGSNNADYLWRVQFKVITDLAEKESCVIVGRCADYILRGKADLLRVFIHADFDVRAKRIVTVYGERDESPEQRLRDKDKRRAAYHRFYTNMKWGYAQNYDLTLNRAIFSTWVAVSSTVSRRMTFTTSLTTLTTKIPRRIGIIAAKRTVCSAKTRSVR